MTKTVQGCEMLAKFEGKNKSKHRPSQSWGCRSNTRKYSKINYLQMRKKGQLSLSKWR